MSLSTTVTEVFAKRATDETATRPTIALGTMNFGKRVPEPRATAIIDAAIERGVRVIDTANLYADGESECIVGRALRGRDDVIVATKVGLARVGGRPEGLSATALLASVEASRKRLDRDALDVLYLHAPDRATPIEETADALATLHENGTVRAIGLSNHASWECLEWSLIAKERGIPRPVVAQQLYNLLVREIEVEFVRFATRHALHTTVYNPLAGGLLSEVALAAEAPPGGRFDGNALYRRRYFTERMRAEAKAYHAIAAEAGIDLVELAYRFLASRTAVDSILVGPSSQAHLDAALAALERGPLAPDLAKAVDAQHRAYLGTDVHYTR
jgi:aryl-alcohol dehydrogenase-like predicted oxidoreductase